VAVGAGLGQGRVAAGGNGRTRPVRAGDHGRTDAGDGRAAPTIFSEERSQMNMSRSQIAIKRK